jgi:hypothetical protein
MTRIPPERPAARSLEESFKRLGEERAAARATPADGRRRPGSAHAGRRVLVIAAAALGVAAAAATGTKVFLADGGSVQGERQIPSQLREAPAYRQLAQARAKDPTEATPWGLRTYTSADGSTCAIVGRVAGQRLGEVRNGRFQQMPSGAAAQCFKFGSEHVLYASRGYPDVAVPGGRRVIYGVVDRTVTSVRLVSATGADEPVAIAADGSFVVVHEGYRSRGRLQLVIEGTHGRQVRLVGR